MKGCHAKILSTYLYVAVFQAILGYAMGIKMNIYTCEDGMEFIGQTEKYGSVLGLESMTHLLNGLDNPQDKLKFIHVAGTNGKGSTTAFISTTLALSAYKVGRYISPSVFKYEEKIQVLSSHDEILTTTYITKEEITKYIKEIKNVCELMVEKGLSHPTTFEIETAMSFMHFVNQNCDMVVLEVGLGGRLDATNVIKNVECCVITSISMDHMNYLGNTIEEIALEKAGIIKKGIPVVSYDQDIRVKHVIGQVCKEQHALLSMADFGNINWLEEDLSGSTFSYVLKRKEKEEQKEFQLKIGLLGRNQVLNGVVALHVIQVLIDKGYKIDTSIIERAFLLTTWSGRFELVKNNPVFVVDGAHNEDAAKQLAENINLYFKGKKIIYILGVLGDKDYEGILKNTAYLANTIITITPNNKRGLPSHKLALVAKDYCKHVLDASTVKSGVEQAMTLAGKDDVIIAFGSLSYLIEIYQNLGMIRS